MRKGKGLDPAIEPPRVKLHCVPPPPPPGVEQCVRGLKLNQDKSDLPIFAPSLTLPQET